MKNILQDEKNKWKLTNTICEILLWCSYAPLLFVFTHLQSTWGTVIRQRSVNKTAKLTWHNNDIHNLFSMKSCRSRCTWHFMNATWWGNIVRSNVIEIQKVLSWANSSFCPAELIKTQTNSIFALHIDQKIKVV